MTAKSNAVIWEKERGPTSLENTRTLAALLMRFPSHRPSKAYIVAVAVLLTLLVGVSRVYLGVYWPTDVLAGWSVGAAWAVLVSAIAAQLQRRGRPLHRA